MKSSQAQFLSKVIPRTLTGVNRLQVRIGPSFFHQTIHTLRLVTLVSLFNVLPHALVLFELIIFVPSIKKSKKVNLK